MGIIDGSPMLDLCYDEDVRADTDMNVVVTGDGRFVEVQGTAEGAPFDRAELDVLLDLALGGCTELARLQQQALQGRAPGPPRWCPPGWCWPRTTRTRSPSCAGSSPTAGLEGIEILGVEQFPDARRTSPRPV